MPVVSGQREGQRLVEGQRATVGKQPLIGECAEGFARPTDSIFTIFILGWRRRHAKLGTQAVDHAVEPGGPLGHALRRRQFRQVAQGVQQQVLIAQLAAERDALAQARRRAVVVALQDADVAEIFERVGQVLLEAVRSGRRQDLFENRRGSGQLPRKVQS
jgi:hypothetical protein